MKHILVLGIIAVISSIPMEASVPAHDYSADVCSVSADVLQGFCGDGICDAYRKENATTCAVDCAPKPLTPTATSTPLPAAVPHVTSTATAPSLTPSPQATPTGQSGTGTCGFVTYNSRESQWQTGYNTNGVPEFLSVKKNDLLNVWVCPEPPSGTLCFTGKDELLNATHGDLAQIAMADCNTDGSCTIVKGSSAAVGDKICFSYAVAGEKTLCSSGCALVPLASGAALFPLNFSNLSISSGVAFLACLGLLLVIGGGFFMVLARRRSQTEN
jgi:hypothetical protein